MDDEKRVHDAVGELVGALCYAVLRVFQVTATGATRALSLELADRQAAFAVDEFDRYRVLRHRLDALVEDPFAAMHALRPTLDAFYEAASTTDWLQMQVFHFVGNTLTTDFADILAARVDDETAFALRRGLTGRTDQQSFALEQITAALEADPEQARLRVAGYTATIVGQGLSRLREALLASDALETVLGGEGAVKELVLELLGRHRERLERLGLDSLDE